MYNECNAHNVFIFYVYIVICYPHKSLGLRNGYFGCNYNISMGFPNV